MFFLSFKQFLFCVTYVKADWETEHHWERWQIKLWVPKIQEIHHNYWGVGLSQYWSSKMWKHHILYSSKTFFVQINNNIGRKNNLTFMNCCLKRYLFLFFSQLTTGFEILREKKEWVASHQRWAGSEQQGR